MFNTTILIIKDRGVKVTKLRGEFKLLVAYIEEMADKKWELAGERLEIIRDHIVLCNYIVGPNHEKSLVVRAKYFWDKSREKWEGENPHKPRLRPLTRQSAPLIPEKAGSIQDSRTAEQKFDDNRNPSHPSSS